MPQAKGLEHLLLESGRERHDNASLGCLLSAQKIQDAAQYYNMILHMIGVPDLKQLLHT